MDSLKKQVLEALRSADHLVRPGSASVRWFAEVARSLGYEKRPGEFPNGGVTRAPLGEQDPAPKPGVYRGVVVVKARDLYPKMILRTTSDSDWTWKDALNALRMFLAVAEALEAENDFDLMSDEDRYIVRGAGTWANMFYGCALSERGPGPHYGYDLQERVRSAAAAAMVTADAYSGGRLVLADVDTMFFSWELERMFDYKDVVDIASKAFGPEIRMDATIASAAAVLSRKKFLVCTEKKNDDSVATRFSELRCWRANY
jgi:hypothetical protein